MSRRARALMLQGTGSHVGKTVLTAALCRALREAGHDVAPFKAQNMALNAYVTRAGGEMGWAQAMQAEAAGLEPAVDMNPILLKPQTGGTQVVVLGKAGATLAAGEYYGRRAEWWAVVTQAYRRLARAHELIVVEGAGSPAEPNLMAADIANMAVARLAAAPVVLVGDIDRGGVFASFVGCLALLPRAGRRRIRGFLVNRFRGERAFLAPALDFLERRSRRPVLGVVPYLPDLRLPEEDSAVLDEAAVAAPARPVVAVVRLPHIANFTDFAPLAAETAIEVRYVRRPAELAGAALVILPGSKDTLADLRWVRATGLAEAVRRHVAAGGRLGGICGGFQMLGRSVEDPSGLEAGGRADGLGLLAVATVLAAAKVTRRVRARLAGSEATFEAYEIHLGRTRGEGVLAPFARVDDGDGGRPDGAVSDDGRVWGSYLHGLFDSPAVRARLLAGLVAGAPGPPEDYRAVREREYARLAAHVRKHIEWAALLRLLGVP